MNILTYAIAIFAFIEITNVLTLYFAPGSTRGNGIGVFKAFEESKQIPSVHSLIKYLIYWVAGTKLIFIFLLVVIIIFGTFKLQIFAVIALILSILTFFLALYPIIRKEDKAGNITPVGYSKSLFAIIAVFIVCFVVVLLIAIL